jgi:hypothetical protein
MQLLQAIISNKSGVTISAPRFASPSIEEFEQSIKNSFMSGPVHTWIRVADKMPHSYKIIIAKV